MALLQISEEQRKLLEGSEAGKAILESLVSAEQELSKKLSEGEAKLAASEKSRKDLEDSLLSPEVLETLNARKQTQSSRKAPVSLESESEPETEEDWDSIPLSKVAQRLRAESHQAFSGLRKEIGTTLKSLTESIQAAFQQVQLEQLEDKQGDSFTAVQKEFEEFSKLPDNRQLRPRELFKKLQDKKELDAERKVKADAAAAAAARQKELESFAENPEGAVSPQATGEKKIPNDAFEEAWRKTPGAEKLLRTE